MSKFQNLTYEEMQNSNGGGWLSNWGVGRIVSKFLGIPGSLAYAYLHYLSTHPKEANELVNEYYKECSRPNYNTD